MRLLFQATLFSWVILAWGAALSVANEPADEEPTIAPSSIASATHEQLRTVVVKGKGGSTLQALATTSDGKIVGLVGPARYAPIGVEGAAAATSEICLFDREGKELQRWALPFAGQSVGVGADGAIYAAGDGKIARYSADGKPQSQADAPHLAELKNEKALREAAEEEMQSQKESIKSMQESKKAIEGIVKGIEETKPEKRTALQKTQLDSYRQYLKNFDDQVKAIAEQKIEDVIEELTTRVRIINAVAATDRDVFIACGELKGYGYAVWRMDADLSNPQRIITGLSGCCGQMDIQAGKDGVYVAENSRKRVAHYDRGGKLISSFGTSGRESNGLSFGGCCNPMNCRVCDNGEIVTAESEGIIKRFSPKGEFLGLLGYVKLTGGCKNVAVAASPKGDRIYFCDIPGSRIIILGPKQAAATAGAQ